MEKNKKQILGKLKLNKLSENSLDKRSMKVLKGGCTCGSTCSETSVSYSANQSEHY